MPRNQKRHIAHIAVSLRLAKLRGRIPNDSIESSVRRGLNGRDYRQDVNTGTYTSKDQTTLTRAKTTTPLGSPETGGRQLVKTWQNLISRPVLLTNIAGHYLTTNSIKRGRSVATPAEDDKRTRLANLSRSPRNSSLAEPTALDRLK